MVTTVNPTKQQVRDWMQQRQASHTPPPTPEQIRREMGWDMLHPPQRKQR